MLFNESLSVFAASSRSKGIDPLLFVDCTATFM